VVVTYAEQKHPKSISEPFCAGVVSKPWGAECMH
jgi:hypothetical protein